MTNGEKLKEIFPSIELYEKSHDAIKIKFNSIWWNAEYKEPTTKNDLALIHTEGLDEEIRCTMCTNSMKSDRGCDGNCVVNKDMYKAVMDAIEKRIQPTTKNDLAVDCISRADAIKAMQDKAKKLTNEDTINGLCGAVAILFDLSSVTPQEPRWIPVSERLPEERLGVLIWCPARKNIYCACYEEKQWWIFGAYWEKVTEEIVAWRPLPTKPYSEVEE